MKINKIAKKIIMYTLLPVALFSCTISSSNTMNKRSADEVSSSLSPKNDLFSGDYRILNSDETKMVTSDSPAAVIQSFLTYRDNDDEISTYNTFSIYHDVNASKYLDYDPYYISTPKDAALRLAVNKAGINSTSIKEGAVTLTNSYSSSNYLSTVYIESVASSRKDIYRLFVVDKDNKYYLSLTTTSNITYTYNIINAITASFYYIEASTCFTFKSVAGNYPLASHLNRVTSAYGFDDSEVEEVSRIGDATSRSTALISKPFSFGINSHNTSLNITKKNNYSWYQLPYNAEEFSFSLSFTYRSYFTNSNLTWAHGLDLGIKRNNKNYYLTTTEPLINNTIAGKDVETGLYGLMKQTDLGTASFDESFSPVSSSVTRYVNGMHDIDLSQNWSEIITGKATLYRLFFAYQIGDCASYNPTYERFYLFSEPFYLSYTGVSEEEFLPLQVTPILEEEELESIQGLEIDENYISTYAGIKKGSLIKNGFTATPLIKNYEYYYSKKVIGPIHEFDTFEEEKIYAKKEFKDEGVYHLRVSEEEHLNTSEGDIFVAPNGFTSFFFGNVYSLTKNNNYSGDDPAYAYFVNGERILTGETPDELKDFNISFPYPGYKFPTYSGEVYLRARAYLSLVPELEIKISHYFDGELIEEKHFNDNIFAFNYPINKPGIYVVDINTTFNNDSAYNPSFSMMFGLVSEKQHPFVNASLIENSRYSYDYIPNFYLVSDGMHQVRYNKKILGFINNYKYVNRPLFYAFASYESALKYSLSKEKEQVIKNRNGTYTYLDINYPNEYEVFSVMYEVAKENIITSYLDYNYLGRYYGWMLDGNVIVGKNGYTNELEIQDKYIGFLNTEINNITKKELINFYTFVKDKDGIISNYVSVYQGNNMVISNLSYEKTVEASFKEAGLKTGTYTFYDHNLAGYVTKITKNYIERNSHCDALIDIASLSSTTTYSYLNNNETIKVARNTVISRIYNPYDSASLVLINGPTSLISNSSDFTSLQLKKVGTYKITVKDRVNNTLTLNVEVE